MKIFQRNQKMTKILDGMKKMMIVMKNYEEMSLRITAAKFG